MLHGKIMAVCCERHMTLMSAVCGQNAWMCNATRVTNTQIHHGAATGRMPATIRSRIFRLSVSYAKYKDWHIHKHNFAWGSVWVSNLVCQCRGWRRSRRGAEEHIWAQGGRVNRGRMETLYEELHSLCSYNMIRVMKSLRRRRRWGRGEGTCGTYRGEEKCMQGFKMNLKEMWAGIA